LGALLGLGLLIGGVARPAASEEPPRVRIGWSASPPEIDGVLSEGEWAAAGRIDGLTQARPIPGGEPSQRSEIFLLSDRDNLYIAARLWDTNPEEIVALRMKRDGEIFADDRVNIAIDPFLDRRNGYFFQVNVNGARRDALIEGGLFEVSWDARWYAKTSIDDEGWTLEVAIPYASINFDPDADVWGFNISRGIRRNDEIDRWADPVLERFVNDLGQAGFLEGMTGLRQGLGLEIQPSGTMRRVDDWNDPRGSNDQRHYTRLDPSLDVFYKITPRLTTSLTANTDFGEVEVDERQVNLTRFDLFFPERRNFFLQDALIFEFGDLEENGRPFFSRRIGILDDGNTRDILAGGKVTGRVGPFKVGFIDTVLDERRDLDRENTLVGRVAANVLGESTLGAIVTSGDPEGEGNNTLLGADFIYKNTSFLGDQSLRGTAWFQATLSDPDPGSDEDLPDGTGLAYGGRLIYPNDRVNWKLAAKVLESRFDPALGFANRTGIRDYEGDYRYRWRPERGPFRTVDSRVQGRLVTATSSTIETGEFSWDPLVLTTPINDIFEIRYRHRYERVEEEFSNLDVPFGTYHFDEARIQITTSRNRNLQGTLEAGYGSFFDGTRTRSKTALELRPSKYLFVELEYELNDIRFPDGRDDDLIHLGRGRLSIQFTPQISWITLLQYDNVGDSLGVNSRFRWIIEDGREFFLVLNQGVDTRDGVQATRTEPLAKLQWAFRF
jgi:hypothetical protein